MRSIEALRQLGAVNTKVRRNGNLQEIPAKNLVPGDIITVEGGDIITADIYLIQASKLQADESVLTGESLPVDKKVTTLDKEIPLAERTNMLFKGTYVTRGTGEAVVVATGMKTELGEISTMAEETEEEFTPLERQLNQLGHKLIWMTGIVAVIIAGAGIFSGKDIYLMIKTSVLLAIAAIPEGLPIVATIALARSVWRMARKNALVERLSSVETLGATDVICTDKTGTLTEGQMTATQVLTDSHRTEIRVNAQNPTGSFIQNEKAVDPLQDKILKELLSVGLLCNNASLQKNQEGTLKGVGELLEVALLFAGKKAGLSRGQLLNSLPEQKEISFDPEIKMMATFHRVNRQHKIAVKGAPESVLKASSHIMTAEGKKKLNKKNREEWLKHNHRLAKKGLRILAFATNKAKSVNTNPYKDLVFIGLIGLMDPPPE